MTLAVAVHADNAIVLAADGRICRPELGGLWIMREDARKLHGFGPFGIAVAGFSGLTDDWLESLRDSRLLEGCADVTKAKGIIRDFIIDFMRRFWGGPAPNGSLLLVGYEADQRTPRAYSLHSGFGFQGSDFNWVGTSTGGVAVDTLALLLMSAWKDRPPLERAKTFGILAVETARLVDQTVGEPTQLAVVTPEHGFRDVSDEISMLRERSAAAVAQLRDTFLADAA